MESNRASTFKVEFQPDGFKIEKYVMEISVPPNFHANQPGKSSSANLDLPECKQFQSGVLSKTTCDYTVKGSFSRGTCKLVNLEFLLPKKIGSQTLVMKPFDIELLGNNNLIQKIEGFEFPSTKLSLNAKPSTSSNGKSSASKPQPTAGRIREFSQPSRYKKNNPGGKEQPTSSKSPPNFTRYCTDVDLFPYWAENVDLIRITWNIRIQESAAGFVLGANYRSGRKEIDPMIAMKKKIASFYNSKDLSDATILCGNLVIPAHRFILSCESIVFESMFTTDMKEKEDGKVEINNIETKILELMIKWIYTKDIQVDKRQDQFDLYQAAHLYEVESLKNWCINKILENLSKENALELFTFGETFGESRILQEALRFIKTHKDRVFENEEIFQDFVVKYPKMMLELVKHQNSRYDDDDW